MQVPTAAIPWPDEVAGLPLHPLVVHAVVVLIPLTALGMIVMASSGQRSKRYSPAVLFIAAAGSAAAFVARWSGGLLRAERGPAVAQHYELGEYLPWAALGLLVMVGLLALMDRQSGGKRNAVGGFYSLTCIVAALAATGLTILTGHSGADLVWG
jgi:uncharacterized membrane protein